MCNAKYKNTCVHKYSYTDKYTNCVLQPNLNRRKYTNRREHIKLSISGRLAPKCEEAGDPDARGGIECLSVVAADEPGAQQTDVRGLRNTKY